MEKSEMVKYIENLLKNSPLRNSPQTNIEILKEHIKFE